MIKNKNNKPDEKNKEVKQRRGIFIITILVSILMSLIFLGVAALINKDFRTAVLSYFPDTATAEEKLAKSFMDIDADELEEKNNNYIFAEREISSFELMESYEDIISPEKLSVYLLKYRLLPKDSTKMTNLEGRHKDTSGWITQEIEEGNPHIIIKDGSKPSLAGVIYDFDIDRAGGLKEAVALFLEEDAKSVSVRPGKTHYAYTNKDMGFSISVPNEIWENITVAPWEDTIDKEETLAFSYADPSSSESSPFVMFWIERYEKSILRSGDLLDRDDNKDRAIVKESTKHFFCISSDKEAPKGEKEGEAYSYLKPYIDEIGASLRAIE